MFRGHAGVRSEIKLQPKPKAIAEFENALQLIWFDLPDKAVKGVD